MNASVINVRADDAREYEWALIKCAGFHTEESKHCSSSLLQCIRNPVAETEKKSH